MSGIAELGFIVVMVDGMGTSFRSRTFENVCYKNLKDAGLPDHIALSLIHISLIKKIKRWKYYI